MDDYYDLGAYERAITTSSPQAQRWFDRGLNWLYGFNHTEAIACFGKALESDPDCAMAHWGISYAAGPNYNLPWVLYDPAGKAQALRESYDAMQRALAVAANATPVEQALIRALDIPIVGDVLRPDLGISSVSSMSGGLVAGAVQVE